MMSNGFGPTADPVSVPASAAASEAIAPQIARIHENVVDRLLAVGIQIFSDHGAILTPEDEAFLHALLAQPPADPILALEGQLLLRAIQGYTAYGDRHWQQALDHYQHSLQIWEELSAPDPLLTGLLTFHLGLTHGQIAQRGERGDWHQSAAYLRRSLAAFRTAQRFDLVCRFSFPLGEVLIHLDAWHELETLAELVLQGQKVAPECQMWAYGWLGEMVLQQGERETVGDYVQQALLHSHRQSSYRAEVLILWARSLVLHQDYDRAWQKVIQAQQQTRPDDPLPLLRQLGLLRQAYLDQGQYSDAYQVKQWGAAIQQQYGLQAFVGASRLPAALGDECPDALASREGDRQALLHHVRGGTALTILYGPSGVGKSSLIEGGLLPVWLKDPQGLPIFVRTYSAWESQLGWALEQALQRRGQAPITSLSTAAMVEHQCQLLLDAEIQPILILDQFEEFFFQNDRPQQRAFFQFLDRLLGAHPTHVLIALREDYLHLLLAGGRDFPDSPHWADILNRDVLHYLGNFSPPIARRVLQNLSTHSTTPLGGDLVDRLVQDLQTPEGEVRPIELQVIGYQLQQEGICDLHGYEHLGPQPKEELTRRYLDQVLQECGPRHREWGEWVLYLLTDENQTRPPKTQAVLLEELGHLISGADQQGERLDLVLQLLATSGLVMVLPDAPAPRYQLVHDYLVGIIRHQKGDRFRELHEQLSRVIRERDLLTRLNEELATSNRALIEEQHQRQQTEGALLRARQEQDRLIEANRHALRHQRDLQKQNQHLQQGNQIARLGLGITLGGAILAILLTLGQSLRYQQMRQQVQGQNQELQTLQRRSQDLQTSLEQAQQDVTKLTANRDLLLETFKKAGWSQGETEQLLSAKEAERTAKINEFLAANRQIPAPSQATNARRAQLKLVYYRKSGDDPKRISQQLQSQGFQNITTPAPKVATPTNTIFFGEGVKPEDVKEVAYALIRANVKVQYIGPLAGDTYKQKAGLIEISGYGQHTGYQPLKVETIEKASKFPLWKK